MDPEETRMQPAPAKRKKSVNVAGLSKSTERIRNNCRVALPGCPVAKREVFDCRRIDPPLKVEIRTIKTKAKTRISKKGSSAVALIRPGDDLSVLAAIDVGATVTGSLWVVRGSEAAVAVDIDAVALAGDWVSATGDSLFFDIRERGLVRKQRQATGTRMKADAELLDCFCLEFSDGKPVWIAGQYLSLVDPIPAQFSEAPSSVPTSAITSL